MTHMAWRLADPRIRRATLAVASAAVVAAGSACASTSWGQAPGITVYDSVLFVSARARENGRDTHELSDTVQFGVAVLRRRISHAEPETIRGADEGPGELVDSTWLSEAQFVAMVRERAGRQRMPYDFSVLYVHGFGTSLHEAWRYTAAARRQSGSSAPWIAFCWPSHGAGVTWPRRGALVMGAYKQDSANAVASRTHFLHALAVLERTIGAPHIVVAAHSLGAQVVSTALAFDTSRRDVPLLRAMAFMVPDIEATYFRDQLITPLTSRSTRVVLYTAGNDRALTLGYLADGFERAGRLNDPPLLHPALETVDVTRGRAEEGWFQRLFGTHHAVHRKTSMLEDLVHIVGAERAAACRVRSGTAQRQGAYWLLLPTAMPPADSLDACPRYAVTDSTGDRS